MCQLKCASGVLKNYAYAQIYTLGLLDDGPSLRLVEMTRREVFGSTQFRTQRAAISKHNLLEDSADAGCGLGILGPINQGMLVASLVDIKRATCARTRSARDAS